ncbi:growth arrest-specific protein 1 [Melospiza melodia melodia]|uniref:growth arrest-specific protein 1 n=1 Tax=Melospiza georgiana TaxID=44398 RepID=UPI0025ABE1CB|nr:growth arrest-specific protein 1 [Melospiza georgiana]
MVARSPARHGGGGRRWPRAAAWLWLAAALGAVWPPRGSLVQGRRLICWQAVLQCQGEPECSYAYNQYAEACAPVLLQQQPPPAGGGDGPAGAAGAAASSRRRCPSHCIAALIQLNHTRRGPALEDCDCAQDENCRATKRAIEPCLPRTSSPTGGGPGGGGPGGPGVMGCTEARRRCDWDSRCSLALNRYMTYCGKLFNGLRCTPECRAVIEDMLAVPKAVLLNDCVCDGLERPICESVKENMARLCFGADMGGNGAGSSGGSDGGLEEYYDEDYEEEPSQKGRDDAEDNAGAEPGFPVQADNAGRLAGAAGALLASILVPLLPRL